MLGNLLILMGVISIAGMFAGGYQLAALHCAKEGAAGCDRSFLETISALMIADEGLLLWAAWVVGVFLVWGGLRLRARGR